MRAPAPLTQALRQTAVGLLGLVRKVPWIHGPIHALAVRAAQSPVGAELIKSVLEPQYLSPADYRRWIARHDTLSPEDRAAIQAHIDRFHTRPLISVIMPVYQPDPQFLKAAIASVKRQLYANWELCLVDDASPDDQTWAILEAEAQDPRVKILRRPVNGHISAASNSALSLATGAFVALMDHDDLLADQALYEVVAELQTHPEADLIYSDEDKINAQGQRFDPHFKTDWNPELLLSQNMVSHLAVIRRRQVEALGGFRPGLEGSQDYDLILRLSEVIPANHIRHIPAILYHWRQRAGAASFSESALEDCIQTSLRAVRDHFDRTGQAGVEVAVLPIDPAWRDIRRPLPDPPPRVSIIVPTRDRADLMAACAAGVLEVTDYPDLELVIVDNDSTEPATKALFDRLCQDDRVRVVSAPGPFNYSAINNLAVTQATGEVLVFLNNDVQVLHANWLTELVAQAARPEVGAVGARLVFEDGRLQHGGVILGVGLPPAIAGHLYTGARADDPGYFHHLHLARNVSAVTGACLAVRREVFRQVGGFDAEHLAVAFNDVDLCLKIGTAGYQVIWTPRAELVHLESASRGSDLKPAHADRFAREGAWMRQTWGDVLDHDPFYGPNFSTLGGNYRLADPPRRIRPWLKSLPTAETR